MQFTWDEQKRQSNLAKHGLDFMDAHKVFAGAIILFEDNRFAYGEKRMVAIGLLGIAVVVVVHVDDDDTIHIISMRQASKNEQKTYFANLWRLSRI